MVTHMQYDEDLIPEIIAGIQVHYKGFFQFGAPDVVVVNVQKNAIWTRMAAIAEAPNTARPSKEDAKYLFDLGPTHLEVEFPEPRHTIMDVQEPFVRDKEIDKDLYYPSDVNRELVRVFPKGFKIEIPKMIREKLGEKIRARFGR
jgi:ribonuclease Z